MSHITITMDFHKTLIECDAWFQTEVSSLVSDVLRWRGREHARSYSQSTLNCVDSAYRKLRHSVREHGHELPANRSVQAVLDRFDIEMHAEEIDEAIESVMRAASESAKPVAGASETVRQLAADGAVLGVVSSAVYHQFLIWALERFDMLDAFTVVTTSASSGYYKSRPEIFWTTLDQLGGAKAAWSVHLGDSLRFDVGGAARAGMRTAWLRHPGSAEAPFDGLRPDLTLNTLVGAQTQLVRLARMAGTDMA